MEDIKIELPKVINPSLELPDPELLAYYRDIESRAIWVLGTIDDTSYEWAQRIIQYNREDANIPIADRKPVKLLVANYGGGLDEARMLVELINLSETPVHAIALGVCASAASMIFLACHKRFALPNATFMFHKGSCSDLTGTYDEICAFVEQYSKDIDKLVEFYKSHTNIDPKTIEEKINGDWYLSATEALEAGIIHEIVKSITTLL